MEERKKKTARRRKEQKIAANKDQIQRIETATPTSAVGRYLAIRKINKSIRQRNLIKCELRKHLFHIPSPAFKHSG